MVSWQCGDKHSKAGKRVCVCARVCVRVCVCVYVGKEGEEKIEVGAKVRGEGSDI